MLLIVSMVYMSSIYTSEHQITELVKISDFNLVCDKKDVLGVVKGGLGGLIFKTPVSSGIECFMENPAKMKVEYGGEGSRRDNFLKVLREEDEEGENNLVGFIFYMMINVGYSSGKKYGFIDTLAVRRKHQNKRYATSLLNYAMSKLEEIEKTNVSLFVSLEDQVAMNFYKENGFKKKVRLEILNILFTKNQLREMMVLKNKN